MYQCNGFQLGLVVLHILTAIPVSVVPANHDEAIHIWSSYMIHKSRVFSPRKIRRFSLLNGVSGMVFGMVSCKFSLQLIYNHPIRKNPEPRHFAAGYARWDSESPCHPAAWRGQHRVGIMGPLRDPLTGWSSISQLFWGIPKLCPIYLMDIQVYPSKIIGISWVKTADMAANEAQCQAYTLQSGKGRNSSPTSIYIYI